jgi:hypothetical protein
MPFVSSVWRQAIARTPSPSGSRQCRTEGILSPGMLGPQYFRDMAGLMSSGAPDPAKMKETMMRYGLVPVVET